MGNDFVPTLRELDEAKLTLDKAICAVEDGRMFIPDNETDRFVRRLSAAYLELDTLTEHMRKQRA